MRKVLIIILCLLMTLVLCAKEYSFDYVYIYNPIETNGKVLQVSSRLHTNKIVFKEKFISFTIRDANFVGFEKDRDIITQDGVEYLVIYFELVEKPSKKCEFRICNKNLIYLHVDADLWVFSNIPIL